MTLKSSLTYTAKSLEDIAQHFDQQAEAASTRAQTSKGRAAYSAWGNARAWREAAEVLRATQLDPEMQEDE